MESDSREEADALADGFGSPHFWSPLWWAITTDVAIELDEIECPVLLTQGAADFVAAEQERLRFLPQISDARFRVLPFRAGHAAQGDAPVHVASLVRETAARGGRRSGRSQCGFGRLVVTRLGVCLIRSRS